MTTHSGLREQTLADYLAVVRRYKWVIIVRRTRRADGGIRFFSA
jgi:hypothetical protein